MSARWTHVDKPTEDGCIMVNTKNSKSFELQKSNDIFYQLYVLTLHNSK